MDQRRSKENYYLDIADAAQKRSTCLRRRFGAIIVRNDEIVATGYKRLYLMALAAILLARFTRDSSRLER